MASWTVHFGDILSERADVLVCSANISLNLSGGVGGEILLRYGDAMQKALHAHLALEGRRFVQPGDVVATPSCGTHFQTIFHAVAVDGFYRTSPTVVREVVAKSLHRAASLMAKRVALVALATGYGRLPMRTFGESIKPLICEDFSPIQEVVIVVPKADQAGELQAGMTN